MDKDKRAQSILVTCDASKFNGDESTFKICCPFKNFGEKPRERSKRQQAQLGQSFPSNVQWLQWLVQPLSERRIFRVCQAGLQISRSRAQVSSAVVSKGVKCGPSSRFEQTQRQQTFFFALSRLFEASKGKLGATEHFVTTTISLEAFCVPARSCFVLVLLEFRVISHRNHFCGRQRYSATLTDAARWICDRC